MIGFMSWGHDDDGDFFLRGILFGFLYLSYIIGGFLFFQWH